MKKSSLFLAALFIAVAGSAQACDDCATTTHVAVSAPASVTVPGPEGTTETFGVPVAGPGQRVEWVDDTYRDLEPRVERVHELRTRMVSKKYDVVKKKVTIEAQIRKVPSASGRHSRLQRGPVAKEKTYLKKETFQESEEYLHPVDQTVYYEVEKVRRIPALVADKCD